LEFRKKNTYLKSREKCRLVVKRKDDKLCNGKFFPQNQKKQELHHEEQKQQMSLLTTSAYYVLRPQIGNIADVYHKCESRAYFHSR